MKKTIAWMICGSAVWLVQSRASADIYRYVDSEGVVHFTNLRPRGGGGWQRVIRGTKPAKYYGAVTPTPVVSSVQVSRSPDAWDTHVREAAALYHLPLSLLRAVMRVESGFNPNVVSHVGALGLMQLMPGTANRMGVRNPFDPRENILGGARYLRILANLFNGDLVLTLAGYNAGENAVLKYGGIPPYDETQRYVRNVLRNYYAFRAQEALTRGPLAKNP